MRKGRDGENEKEREWKTMMFIVANNVDASRLPEANQLERRILVPIMFLP